MKQKQIVVLCIIFGILAFGILLKSWVRSVDDNAGAAPGGRAAFAEFNPSKLERILIGRGSRVPAIELAKDNGVWKVKSLWNAKADAGKIENLIQKLGSVQGELRGSGKNLFADFGIQDTEAFSIKFFGSGNISLQDLWLGMKQAGENGYFFRQGTSENIYLVEVNMAELLGISTALDEATLESLFWADLSLFSLDPEKVTKITVDHFKGDEKIAVLGLLRAANPKDPSKNIWKFLRPDMKLPIDPEKVLKLIATLTSIKAQKVMDPSGAGYGLEKPVWQLAVNEGDKKTLLSVGPKAGKEDLYYVKTSAEASVFSLNAGYFDDLNVTDTHFVKEVVPAVAPKENSPPKAGEQAL